MTIVGNRRELKHSVSGVIDGQYAPRDIKYLIDRLHTENASALLDLEHLEQAEVVPRFSCTPALTHTEDSLNILVDTDDETGVVTGDSVYDVRDQVIEPHIPANSS